MQLQVKLQEEVEITYLEATKQQSSYRPIYLEVSR